MNVANIEIVYERASSGSASVAVVCIELPLLFDYQYGTRSPSTIVLVS